MRKIEQKIAEIETRFLKRILAIDPDVRTEDVERIGLVRPYFDQSAGRFGLQTVDEDTMHRVSLNTGEYDLQIAHVMQGFTPTGQVPYGSFLTPTGEIKLTMIGAGILPYAAREALLSVQETSYLRIEGLNVDTQSVLSAHWRFDLSTAPGVDPMVTGFALQYAVRGVEVIDFL